MPALSTTRLIVAAATAALAVVGAVDQDQALTHGTSVNKGLFPRQLQLIVPEPGCDTDNLDDVTNDLNRACCTTTTCQNAAPTQCSGGCALAMATAFDGGCRATLARLSVAVSTLWQTCLALPAATVATAIAPTCPPPPPRAPPPPPQRAPPPPPVVPPPPPPPPPSGYICPGRYMTPCFTARGEAGCQDMGICSSEAVTRAMPPSDYGGCVFGCAISYQRRWILHSK